MNQQDGVLKSTSVVGLHRGSPPDQSQHEVRVSKLVEEKNSAQFEAPSFVLLFTDIPNIEMENISLQSVPIHNESTHMKSGS